MSARGFVRRPSPLAAVVLWSASGLLACSSETPSLEGAVGDEDRDGSRVAATDAGKTPDAGRGAADSGSSSEADASATSPASRANSDEDDGNNTCAKAELMTQRVVPKVWLLIDGSGSMAAPLTGLIGPSRWEVLRDALLNSSDGLISKLQSAVAFGLMAYDGGLSPTGIYVPELCPRTIVVDPAIENFNAIDGAYPAAELGSSTPTHYALLALSDRIKMVRDTGDTTPTYVVLATDGAPNLCDFHDGIPATPDTEQEAVDTVAQLAAQGTKTFAISLAGDDRELKAHLDAVAKAGATGKGSFTTNSQDDLVKALTEILGGTTSCSIRLEGRIEPGHECDGDVTLDGKMLGCDDANGYRVPDDHTSIELVGDACDALQRQPSAVLSAKFPCDAVVLL